MFDTAYIQSLIDCKPLKRMFDRTFHETLLTLPDDMARARHAVKAHPDKVVVFTGAGISAESGISPFRNATDEDEALWEKYDPTVLSSMNGFMEDPALVWGWYLDRLLHAMQCEPNPGHHALTFNDAPVITQNIDLLHEKAGSTKVLHMHGRGDRAKCTACSWHGQFEMLVRLPDSLPQCPSCGSLARPDVVWFGEYLDPTLMAEARELVTGSICIVAGTSGVVEPMASFPKFAGLVISVNPRHEDHISGALKLTGKAGEVLPQLFA